jgi:hypothetical protein
MTTSDAFSPGLSRQGVKGSDPQERLGGGLPASLPDEAYLMRLANEMFAQVPVDGPNGLNLGGQSSGLQGGAPSNPSLAADAPGPWRCRDDEQLESPPIGAWRFHSRHG